MPTPDELFPDGDPADWPMCDGTFRICNTPAELTLPKRLQANCPTCSQRVGAIRWEEHAVRLCFHTAPRRYRATE